MRKRKRIAIDDFDKSNDMSCCSDIFEVIENLQPEVYRPRRMKPYLEREYVVRNNKWELRFDL